MHEIEDGYRYTIMTGGNGTWEKNREVQKHRIGLLVGGCFWMKKRSWSVSEAVMTNG